MLCIIIPIKSEIVSKDWALFCKLFERTLRSLGQQTDQNFKVVIVCHENPVIDYQHHNFEFVKVNFEPPSLTAKNKDIHNALKEEDKANKIMCGIRYADKYEVTNFMVLDSDDCVRKDLVHYVNSQSVGDGWFINKGYLYKEGGKLLFLNSKNFHTLCGSTFIISPSLINKMFIYTPHIRYAHEQVDPLSFGLKPLPFPGVVYSIGNGENHLMSVETAKKYNNSFKSFSIGFFKSIYRKLTKYKIRIITSNFRDKYGLIKIYS